MGKYKGSRKSHYHLDRVGGEFGAQLDRARKIYGDPECLVCNRRITKRQERRTFVNSGPGEPHQFFHIRTCFPGSKNWLLFRRSFETLQYYCSLNGLTDHLKYWMEQKGYTRELLESSDGKLDKAISKILHFKPIKSKKRRRQMAKKTGKGEENENANLEIPEECFDHPDIGDDLTTLTEMEQKSSPEGHAIRVKLRKAGFKLSDPDTWEDFTDGKSKKPKKSKDDDDEDAPKKKKKKTKEVEEDEEEEEEKPKKKKKKKAKEVEEEEEEEEEKPKKAKKKRKSRARDEDDDDDD